MTVKLQSTNVTRDRHEAPVARRRARMSTNRLDPVLRGLVRPARWRRSARLEFFCTNAAGRWKDRAMRSPDAVGLRTASMTLRGLLGGTIAPAAHVGDEEAARRTFLLQYVQPGLAGLMDGSVSTLAPLFTAAFATHNTWTTFLVGLAASVGAGISMGFAEALSDDGSLTGRGAPGMRGLVCGVMTGLGGVGHAAPYLIPHFYIATTCACIVVAIELAVISWIRTRFMDTPFLRAAFQVVIGGVLVFLAGILIGSS
jgi:VIT1/CCC1 family predicted Fe2+/Mn2+ transporter